MNSVFETLVAVPNKFLGQEFAIRIKPITIPPAEYPTISINKRWPI